MQSFTPTNVHGTGYLYVAPIHEIQVRNFGPFGSVELHFNSDREQSVMLCLGDADRKRLITALQKED